VSAEQLVFAIAAIVIAAVCALLVFVRAYPDGLWGRVALVLMALASLLPLLEVFEGVEHQVLPSTLVMHIGIALFLMRHWWRFRAYCRSCERSAP
jgi:hypothetical protein